MRMTAEEFAKYTKKALHMNKGEESLAFYLRAYMPGIRYLRQYKFHPKRRWRADGALPDHKILIEIEGGAWIQGRHNRGKGFLDDMEKYNAAAVLGWRVLRFTPQQAGDGSAIATIIEAIK